MATTFERLSNILIERNKLSPDTLTPQATLEQLQLDSLGVIELLFNVEDEFGITLPSENVTLTTLADVVQHIDELVLAQSPDSRRAKRVEGAADLAATNPAP